MKENILIDKSIDFGARIVKLHRYLSETKHESIIAKQILRSGTSIGANIMAASMLSDCLEIKRILITSINPAKQNNN